MASNNSKKVRVFFGWSRTPPRLRRAIGTWEKVSGVKRDSAKHLATSNYAKQLHFCAAWLIYSHPIVVGLTWAVIFSMALNFKRVFGATINLAINFGSERWHLSSWIKSFGNAFFGFFWGNISVPQVQISWENEITSLSIKTFIMQLPKHSTTAPPVMNHTIS